MLVRLLPSCTSTEPDDAQLSGMNSVRYGLARERQQSVYVNIAICHAQRRPGGVAMAAKALVVAAWRREDAGAG